MSNEELVTAIQSGNTELYCELWQNNIRFISGQAYRFYIEHKDRCTCDIDDLIQSGYIALNDAVTGYSPASDCKFLTYLGYHLKRAFYDCAGIRKKADAMSYVVQSLDAPVYEDNDSVSVIDMVIKDSSTGVIRCGTDNNDSSMINSYADVEHKLDNERLHSALEQMLDTIADQQARVLRQHYYEDESLTDISHDMELSIQRISQIKADALRLLKHKALHTPLGKQLETYLDSFMNPYYKSTEKTALKRIELTQRAMNKITAGEQSIVFKNTSLQPQPNTTAGIKQLESYVLQYSQHHA